MKYNPTYHQSVVGNYRQLFRTRHGHDFDGTDEEVWNCHNNNAFVEDADEETINDMLIREQLLP